MGGGVATVMQLGGAHGVSSRYTITSIYTAWSNSYLVLVSLVPHARRERSPMDAEFHEFQSITLCASLEWNELRSAR